jgi:hypothetical protein
MQIQRSIGFAEGFGFSDQWAALHGITRYNSINKPARDFGIQTNGLGLQSFENSNCRIPSRKKEPGLHPEATG